MQEAMLEQQPQVKSLDVFGIAERLYKKLLAQSEADKLKAEGVAMLFDELVAESKRMAQEAEAPAAAEAMPEEASKLEQPVEPEVLPPLGAGEKL